MASDKPTAIQFTLALHLRIYLLRHLQNFFYSLGQLWRAPFATLMTILVIGIALALPAGLYVVLDNAQRLSGGWKGGAQISLFLQQGMTPQAADGLKNRLTQRKDITHVEFISASAALEEFQQRSGFGDALKALGENPLPAVMVVIPDLQHSDTDSLQQLLRQCQEMPEVELAQLDMQWVQRLFAIMHIIQQGVLVLALLLAMAVVLTIGNTIRLAIQSRRQEIVVMKLIGATNAFIRRPFLYTGFWYGLSGGLMAWLLVKLSLLTLSDAVKQLANLYSQPFALESLPFFTTLALLFASIFLGLTGSWLAVGKHLRDIEPS